MPSGLDPRTPVLVGSAAITQRAGDPTTADDAVTLMAHALRASADDAGGPDPQRLISRAELIMAPQASWKCADPGRMVADQLGITPRTLCAELGVLQQALFTRACTAIAGGRASVVLVCGGEARSRAATAAKSGISVAAEPESNGPADVVLSPNQQVISKLEIERKLYVPARQYAIMDTALRGAAGQSISDHAKEVAGLWDAFADVARTRPEAWKRDAVPLGDGQAGPANPWYAWPYTKQHCSYWTVDQAGGFILCSVEAAVAAHVPRDHWIFPVAAAESNAMIMLSERAEPHRSPAIAAAGRALRDLAGIAPAESDHFDIYSCFPAAVRVQAAELGLPADRPWTVTGGMSFGGGPLNNYVLQSTARMAQVLREDPGSTGLVTSISGMITKQGMGLWSTTPPAGGFRAADVTGQAHAETATAIVDGDYHGPASVVGYTVGYDGPNPMVGIIIGRATVSSSGADSSPDTPVHTVATTADPQLMDALMAEEWVGRQVEIDGPTFSG